MGSKLDGVIPDFIRRAEAKINRRLHLRAMERLAFYDYEASATSRYIDLPKRFLELISLSTKKASESDTAFLPMRYVAPADIMGYVVDNRERPRYYTLRNYLEVNSLPDVDYTLRMHYLKGWDIEAENTNWLLTNYPDIYLYGALLEATAYLQDDPRLPVWADLFIAAMKDANALDDSSRNDTTLSTHELASLNSYGTYNIVSDD